MPSLPESSIPVEQNSGNSGDGDDTLSRVKAAAEELVAQEPGVRAYNLPIRAREIGQPEKVLRAVVNARLREISNRNAAEQLERDRQQKRLADEQKRLQKQHDDEQKRLEQQRAAEEKRQEKQRKDAEREAKRAQREAERAQREAERVAKQKSKDRAKGLANIARLPVARHDQELSRLAAQLGDGVDVAALRAEFAELIGIGGGGVSARGTEPWPDPVNTSELLKEAAAKLRKHVVLVQEHQLTAAVIWTAHAWTYDHGVPTHSPNLVATSAEWDSGKSMLIAVIGRMSPRFSLNVEMTGPSLFRFVDANKPTLGLDEADDIFTRRSDLKHIVNAGWKRDDAFIPRVETIGGVKITIRFDVFTPKMIALLGSKLPPATRSRCIELRMLPKRRDEQVEPFNQLDDAEFAVLRRKFARWAADNSPALKVAHPVIPADLNNRAAANWKLLLAIAELVGESWSTRTRAAAEQLSRNRRQPSDGVKLLAEFKAIFAGCKWITSAAVEAKLREDPTSIWAEYHGISPIRQRQIAHLLDRYDIQPTSVGPQRLKGYRVEQFEDAFARFLPHDPLVRSQSVDLHDVKVVRGVKPPASAERPAASKPKKSKPKKSKRKPKKSGRADRRS